MKLGPAETSELPPAIMKVGNIIEGGGCVIDTPNGLFLEYTCGHADQIHEVFRTHIGEDIARQFSHLLLFEMGVNLCKTLGVTTAVWRKKARGTVQQRVECILDIAAVFGWHVIDDDPLELSYQELRARWDGPRREGPITASTETVAVVRELLVALLQENPETYWSLFNRDFPLVPEEPLRDPTHIWWEKHGPEVQKLALSELQKNAPAGMKLEVRDGRWGFWYN